LNTPPPYYIFLRWLKKLALHLLLFSSQKSTKLASPLTPKTTWGWRRENMVGEEAEKEQGGVGREKVK